MGIEAVNPFELPLLNTVILLSSGVTVTYAHHSLIQGNRSGALYGLVATLFLAVVFTGFQGIEYTVSSFTISDGAFGSCCYFGTGFHGFALHIPFFYCNNYNNYTYTLRINTPGRQSWRMGASAPIDMPRSFKNRVFYSSTTSSLNIIEPEF